MGYGKTVAVREYLRRRWTRTIWISVPGAGEDAFWRDFCRAVARAFADAPDCTDCENVGDTVESLFRLGYPRDAVQADAACELLQQLDFSPETVLVADDVHLLPESVPGGGMAGLCTMLARRNPEHLRLVLISRDTWPGDRGGREMLALKGQLAVIDRETLALNAREIRAYYARCGLPLGMEEAESLHEATGGWISALFLYLLHYGKHGCLARPTAVATLLEREVFLPLVANGGQVTLTFDGGAALAHQKISWSVSGPGQPITTPAQTDAEGKATAVLTAADQGSGDIVIKATVDGKEYSVTVTIASPCAIDLVAGTPNPAMDGSSVMTATVKKNGVIASGENVVFTWQVKGSKQDQQSGATVSTDSSGVARYTLSNNSLDRYSNTRRTITVTATLQSDTSKRDTEEVQFGDALPSGFIALASVAKNWDDAGSYCDAQGGKLPRINDSDSWGGGSISSIDGFVSFGRPWPSELPGGGYWTGTEDSRSLRYAWVLFFANGYVGDLNDGKGIDKRVVCVP